MIKSKEFISDYIIGIYETQGNFDNISRTKFYNTFYKKINADKTQGDIKESVVDYIYSMIGYEGVDYISPATVYQLTTHCMQYNTISNLKKVDKTLYKKYTELISMYEEDGKKEKDLLDSIGLGHYLDKEVSKSSRANNINLSLALFSLYAPIISNEKDFLMELTRYFNENRVFNIAKMVKEAPYLIKTLSDIIPFYGGETSMDIESDLIMHKGKWYSKGKYTDTRAVLLENIMYMIFNIKPKAPLTAFEKLSVDNYYRQHGNFRYMYRRNKALYKRLINITLELGISFKELLESQGYAYDALTYSSIDYTSKGNLIEARIASVSSNEVVLMDRKVYAYLYDSGSLLDITIKPFKVKDANGNDLELRVVSYGNKNELKGKMVATMYNGATHVNYRDGNLLNISSINTIPV